MSVFSGAREGGKVGGELRGRTHKRTSTWRTLVGTTPRRRCACGTAKALLWFSKLVNSLQKSEPRTKRVAFTFSIQFVVSSPSPPLRPPPPSSCSYGHCARKRLSLAISNHNSKRFAPPARTIPLGVLSRCFRLFGGGCVHRCHAGCHAVVPHSRRRRRDVLRLRHPERIGFVGAERNGAAERGRHGHLAALHGASHGPIRSHVR